MTSAPGHVVELSDGWRLWRETCLRGAGFPAHHVLSLAPAPALSAAIGALLEGEAAEAKLRSAALAACEESTQGVTRETGKRLGQAIRQLRAQGVPPPTGASAQVDELLSALAVLSAQNHARRQALEGAYEADRIRGARALREAAADDRFREAIAWQNPHVLRGGIDFLRRQPPEATGFKVRQNEALVASYLQRYCLRNETIGFFGPVGWARWEGAGPALTLHTSGALVEKRTTYFEYWCIDALASHLAGDEALRPQLRPRRLPTVRLEGTRLHHPVDRVSQLPRAFARTLEACDGERSAEELAATLRADASLGLESDQDVYDVLDELARNQLISWSLIVPPAGPFPERTLRQVLLGMRATPATQRALGALAELEEARQSVVLAADRSQALQEALEELSDRFMRLTGGRADTRSSGKTYAGRTLVYEDCRRAARVQLGPALLEPLAAPLSLILESARFYTHAIAEKYRATFQREFDTLRAESGQQTVSFLRFFERASTHFKSGSDAPPIVTAVLEDFHARWRRVLGYTPDQQRLDLRSEALRPTVQEAFSAPGPGWPKARHVAPDVLISATDAEAACRGEFSFILGEVHVGQCTKTHMLFLKEHPEPEALVAAREADLGTGLVDFVEPRTFAGRTVDFSPSAHDFDVETGDTPSARPRSQVLSVAELVVEADGEGALIIRTLDGERRWDAIAFLEHYLLAEASDFFKLFPAVRHLPRITIDRLVMQRETWRFASQELSFAHLESPVERYIGLQRWHRAHSLPRHAFFRASSEPKPCFVDFESPTFAELFLKLARNSESISVSEMLPGFDALWLTDAAGQRYTSELRLTAVDPLSFRGPVSRR
ncbi:MAG: lantibiotic dehydratase [Hyalangium sp.]|uniref:lantibiotic dehydratase n=1 Tax=Hyalangium sp. TaxID=2028555 RepID=UPI00389AF73F